MRNLPHFMIVHQIITLGSNILAVRAVIWRMSEWKPEPGVAYVTLRCRSRLAMHVLVQGNFLGFGILNHNGGAWSSGVAQCIALSSCHATQWSRNDFFIV